MSAALTTRLIEEYASVARALPATIVCAFCFIPAPDSRP